MFKRPELFPKGFHLYKMPLDPKIREWVRMDQWEEVDLAFKKLTAPAGSLFSLLQEFHSFSQIETMISIRDASNDWEEDGIWHDDGSRVFAFSLSLTIDADQVDGTLELRRKNSEECESLPTPEFGTAILFLTGVHGYEHRTRAVKRGRRVILVGWCS